MTLGTRLVVAVCAAGMVAGATVRPAAAQPLEGCWFFLKDPEVRSLNLPWGVRLAADPLTGWPGLADEPDVHVALTLESRTDIRREPFGYWQALGPDSLRVGYPGMGGLVLWLGRQGRRLTGTARPVGDAGLEPGPDRTVRLLRGPCPDGV